MISFDKKGDFFSKNEKTENLKLRIMREVASVAERHYKKGFITGGGATDAGKWEPRDGNKEPERAILVKKRVLKKSIKSSKISSKAVVLTSEIFGSKYDYAADHNYGLGNQKKREFLGPSKVLNIKIEKIAEKAIKAWITGA
jgi:phage gpG-like protein